MTVLPIVAFVVAAIVAGSILAAAGLAIFTWWTNRRVLAALAPQGQFYSCAGVRFHVHDQGAGPVVLLVHGLAGQMRHFTYGVSKHLARNCRVVTIDRPGSGHSLRPADSPADVSAQAAAIASLIGHLQLGRVVVGGHSLGGAIALTLAIEHPHCVSGLALIAPLTHAPEDARPPAAFRALTIASASLRTLFAWTLVIPGTIARRHAVLDQVFGPDPVPHDFAIRGGGLMGLCPHQFIAASRDLQAIPDKLPAITARYSELRIPVRILYGRGDRILNWKANGQALADKVDDATLTLMDGGHMLPVTYPELTAKFIQDTVNQVSDGAGTGSANASA